MKNQDEEDKDASVTTFYSTLLKVIVNEIRETQINIMHMEQETKLSLSTCNMKLYVENCKETTKINFANHRFQGQCKKSIILPYTKNNLENKNFKNHTT